MNRLSAILNSSLKRNIGLASMTALAALYTIPRVGSETNAIQTALNGPVSVGKNSASVNSPGWDLANLDHPRVNPPDPSKFYGHRSQIRRRRFRCAAERELRPAALHA